MFGKPEVYDKKIIKLNDAVSVLDHLVRGLRRDVNECIARLNTLEQYERLAKVEEYVYPPKRVLQGHKR